MLKLMRNVSISALILCLPAGIGGQGVLDLGYTGAAFAEKGGSGKGGGSDKAKDRGGRDKAKSDRGKSGTKDRARDRGRSGKSAGGKSDRTRTANARGGGSERSRNAGSSASENLWSNIRDGFRGKPAERETAKPLRKAERQLRRAESAAPRVSAAPVARPATRDSLLDASLSTAPLASQLKGMKSLNRNVNGLMNSSDPKMAPFRDFVRTSAEREQTLEDWREASETLEISRDAYRDVAEEYDLSEDPELGRQELIDRTNAHLDVQPAPDDPAYDEWYRELERLNDALSVSERYESDQATVEDLDRTVADLDEAVSEEAMRRAIVESLNTNGSGTVTEDDITPEMEDWVAGRLGIGDDDGLIDDYMAQRPEDDLEEGLPEDDDRAFEDDSEDDEDLVEVTYRAPAE